jgi:hypothetical protein
VVLKKGMHNIKAIIKKLNSFGKAFLKMKKLPTFQTYTITLLKIKFFKI